jgi:GTP-binding protein YchF
VSSGNVDSRLSLRYDVLREVVEKMKIGIIGPALSGKTILFQLLTGTASGAGSKGAVLQGAARVPDERIEELVKTFKPKKTTYATVECADFPSLGSGCELTGETASRLKACDALAVVVRVHADQSVPWSKSPVPPDAAFSAFLHEMILSDLCQVEAILARNKDKKRTPDEERVLKRCQELLEETKPIFAGSWGADDEPVLKNYAFLSSRPVLVAINLDEEQLQSQTYEGRASLQALSKDNGYPLVEFCGSLEVEISRMNKTEQEIFLAEYGLTQSGITRFAAAAYRLLDLISFFTVGEDEVRAWTIKSGTTAKKAAGKIHSDIERGFIRAEVINYADFLGLGSSLKIARDQGKLRLEGKEYLVKDGDIINFRFNV